MPPEDYTGIQPIKYHFYLVRIWSDSSCKRMLEQFDYRSYWDMDDDKEVEMFHSEFQQTFPDFINICYDIEKLYFCTVDQILTGV